MAMSVTFGDLLRDSQYRVIFTGAGISTESGIPDFRSPNGYWTRNKPVMFQDFVNSENERRRAWQMKFDLEEMVGDVKPNRAHFAVAGLVEGGAGVVITQNIDGLHQDAGVAEDQVIELHGTARHAVCLDCGHRHALAPIRVAFKRDGILPACERCGGLVKSATISFGQQMPETPMRRAHAESRACDLFLVLGSSLVVQPAAGFPALAKNAGARLVIVNRDETPLDDQADLVIRDDIGDVLSAAIGM